MAKPPHTGSKLGIAQFIFEKVCKKNNKYKVNFKIRKVITNIEIVRIVTKPVFIPKIRYTQHIGWAIGLEYQETEKNNTGFYQQVEVFL